MYPKSSCFGFFHCTNYAHEATSHFSCLGGQLQKRYYWEKWFSGETWKKCEHLRDRTLICFWRMFRIKTSWMFLNRCLQYTPRNFSFFLNLRLINIHSSSKFHLKSIFPLQCLRNWHRKHFSFVSIWNKQSKRNRPQVVFRWGCWLCAKCKIFWPDDHKHETVQFSFPRQFFQIISIVQKNKLLVLG